MTLGMISSYGPLIWGSSCIRLGLENMDQYMYNRVQKLFVK